MAEARLSGKTPIYSCWAAVQRLQAGQACFPLRQCLAWPNDEKSPFIIRPLTRPGRRDDLPGRS